MTIWLTGTSDPESKISTTALLAVSLMVLGLAVWGIPSTGSRTASSLKAIVSESGLPTETSFAPRQIEWEGYVRRILVGGEGLEIAGSDAPGGVFQVYASGQIPITEGSVLIKGLWRGYTCAYGGHNGRCVPDVELGT